MSMKHLAYAAGIGAGAALLFSGCAGIKDLHTAMGEAVHADEVTMRQLHIVKNKTTKNEIFRAIGAPGLVFNDKQGETWVYPRIAVRRSDAGFQARGNFATIFPYSPHTISRGGGFAGVGVASGVDAKRSSYKSAGLLIKFNLQGCVRGYEFTATSF